MERTIGDLSGHVIVVGFGAMGQQAAAAFRTAGRVVVVIDKTDAAANEAAAAGFHAIQGDAALDTTQKAARIDRAEALVISILAGADKLSIVLIARALHPTLHIETLASSEHASEWLRHAGADIVIRSEELVAREFVQALSVRQGARQGSPAGRTSPPR
jgi:voltage-gated potassium channel Kch